VSVSVDTRTTQDSATGAEREFWRADGAAPVKIHVHQHSPEGRFCLCVHEVWWADLDDKETLRNRLKFWFWGLGFWGVRKFDHSSLPGAARMQLPEYPPMPGGSRIRELLVRARLWTFANVFILSALTLNLLNSVLRGLGLGRMPAVEVFYQFLGDVKLYQDRGNPGRGPLTDLDDPRRVAIRRRLVQVFVDAYRADYDRWYVLAHSLGTVVAWNGLMETEHALPNYLNQETYDALKSSGDPVLGPQRSGTVLSVANMRPARPVWIRAADEVLYRDILFRNLRGFVTYGSPLDKFAYLWRAIVAINRDTSVWHDDFEWVNVYEHTDPVSSRLVAFSAPPGSPTPANYAYKASRVLLWSHLRYLSLKKRFKQDAFVLRLARWILDERSRFPAPAPADSSWYRSTSPLFGLLLRTPMWIAVTSLLAIALGWLGVPALLGLLDWVAGLGFLHDTRFDSWISELHRKFSALKFPARFGGALIVSAVVVTLTGGARWLLEGYMPRPLSTGRGDPASTHADPGVTQSQPAR
jgi:hypothetical protein